jgi:signal transduction histidine kinase
MNRLWMRLSLAFSAVVLISMLMIIAAIILLARADFLQSSMLDSLRGSNGMMEELASYYRAHQSWQDVGVFLAGAESLLPSEMRLAFSVQDTATQTVYSAHPEASVAPLASVPIMVDGAVRGMLNLLRVRTDPPEKYREFFLARLHDLLLLVAVVGGIVGVLFGMLVSRTLSAPLERLAAAAQAIGARDLHYRVPITGSQEIVAVSRAFNNMAAALEQGETLRRNLLADVAHELRTPVSVLQGNLLAILDNVYPLDAAEIARLYSQTHLLSRLVNDLHELSQAEARQLHLNLQATDIAHLLNNVVAAFNPTAEAESVRMELVAAELPMVLVDPLRLTQVLDNLLGNAVRHTPAGGVITLRAEASDTHLCLTVTDTGEGIAPEHLPHVFDRFYRTNRGRSRATGGTGLGLAIVRAIVEMHGGQVSVSSEGVPGHGAAFAVQLPLKPPVQPAEISAITPTATTAA